MNQTESTAAMSIPEAFAQDCKMLGSIEIRVSHRVNGTTQVFVLSLPFAFIGRSQLMGVRLDDPSVSQCHAYLQVIEGLPYIVDLGSRTGVIWDDGSQGRGWVYPGHTLRMGTFDVQISSSGRQGVPTPTHEEPIGIDASRDDFLPPVVIEVHGPGSRSGGHHPLDRPITLIGRHPGCELRFLDDAISYFHCALVNTPTGAWCLDILSRKGTLLNGRPTRLTRLRDGDLLELGTVSLLVKLGSQSAHPLLLNGTTSGIDTVAVQTISPPNLAESMSSSFVPFREVIDQFQQCFMTMAQMFTAMQQEHAATVYEQMQMMQELMKELRELRSESKKNGSGLHAVPNSTANNRVPQPPATTPGPRLPTQYVVEGADAEVLTDAHTWFLDRLAKMRQSPSPPPTRG